MRIFRIISAQHAAAEQAGETGPLIHHVGTLGTVLRQLKRLLTGQVDTEVDHLAEQVCFP